MDYIKITYNGKCLFIKFSFYYDDKSKSHTEDIFEKDKIVALKRVFG